MFCRKQPPPPPSQEVLNLVGGHLDPQSVAIASCVCKSWNDTLSSEDIWRDVCKIHYPSLAAVVSDPPLPMDRRLAPVSLPPVTYRRLCAMGFSAVLRRHKHVVPKIRISIDDLIFNIVVKTRYDRENPIISLWNPSPCPSTEGRFKFNIETDPVDLVGVPEQCQYVQYVVTWNVFLKGWRGMHSIMDNSRAPRHMPLTCKVRCSSSEKIIATFELVPTIINNGEIIKANKVIVGMQGVWRHANDSLLTVDEGLRFLQHFLLPCQFPLTV
ncbi:hypothetical protein ACFE04_002928 [Oxalis oulophora]